MTAVVSEESERKVFKGGWETDREGLRRKDEKKW